MPFLLGACAYDRISAVFLQLAVEKRIRRPPERRIVSQDEVPASDPPRHVRPPGGRQSGPQGK